jgi:hypothetical protein
MILNQIVENELFGNCDLKTQKAVVSNRRY